MNLTEILSKIVENPHYLDNYVILQDYFKQNNKQDLSEAITHLIEMKYGSNNPNSSEQGQ